MPNLCPIKTDMNLVDSITVAADDIRDTPRVFANVRQSLSCMRETCITADEDLLRNFLAHVR